MYTLDRLQTAIATAPEQWRPLVLTNGCFDLLHAGHVRYLNAAKALGRSLVVGINSDTSVAGLKPQPPGMPPRPLIPEHQRAEIIAALKAVDATIIFTETTADRLITTLKPDIYVKGGDYDLDTLPETPAVRAIGGQIRFVRVEVPTSTSAIVRRILDVPGLRG